MLPWPCFRGAFFQTGADNVEGEDVGVAGTIRQRDFSAPTGEDKMDKSILPQIMQVRPAQGYFLLIASRCAGVAVMSGLKFATSPGSEERGGVTCSWGLGASPGVRASVWLAGLGC